MPNPFEKFGKVEKQNDNPFGAFSFKPIAKTPTQAVTERLETLPKPDKLKLFQLIGKPAIETAGLIAGGLVGAPVAPPLGAIGGAAGGYAIAKKTGEIIEKGLDPKRETLTTTQEIAKSLDDVTRGMIMEMGGQNAVKVLQLGAKGLKGASSQLLGKLTGVGAEPIKKAFEGSAIFVDAMRKKITGFEVVQIARQALGHIKDLRATQYQNQLARLGETTLPAVQGQSGVINPQPIINKLTHLAKQYRIGLKINKSGQSVIDISKAGMGKAGRKDISDIIEEVGLWDDFSPLGLDALKRRVSDFYSDSSQARQFVTSLEKTIKDTLVDNVPGYARMTKDYAQMTRIIKDIESNLMMRKKGMSGRIVADQTLRRLISAMKDNFELRKEIVLELTNIGKKDVMGAVAGHAMSPWVPRGITGSGLGLTTMGLTTMVNWKWLPVVLASSPRISGEFLGVLGKFAKQYRGTLPTVGRVIGVEAGKQFQPENQR